MEINLELDPKTIEKHLSTEILNSALGETLKEVMQEAVNDMTKGFDNPLKKAIKSQCHAILIQIIKDEYGDMLRAKIKEKITDDIMEELVSKAWYSYLDTLNVRSR